MEAAFGIYLLQHPEYSFVYAPTYAKQYVPLRIKVLFGYLWAAGMFALAISGLFVAKLARPATWAIFKWSGSSIDDSTGLMAAIVRHRLSGGKKPPLWQQSARHKCRSASPPTNSPE